LTPPGGRGQGARSGYRMTESNVTEGYLVLCKDL